jgi:outer membrane protein assembly factor BamD
MRSAPHRLLVSGALACAVLLAAGCRKDLDKVPKDKDAGLTAQQLYDKGSTLMKKDRYYQARQTLEKVLGRQNAGSALLADTNLAIADAYYYDGGVINVAEALSRYTSFLTFYPGHPRADYAQYQLGLSYIKQALGPEKDQTTTRQALAAFRKVELNHPTSDFVTAAREKADVCRDRLSEAELRVGLFYMKRKAWQGAADRFRAIIDLHPRYARRDRVYFLLGQALQSQKKQAEAQLYFQKVVDEFPQSRYASQAREALEADTDSPGRRAEAPKEKKSSSIRDEASSVRDDASVGTVSRGGT